MTNNRGSQPQNRRHVNHAANPYETGQSRRPNSLGGIAKDLGNSVTDAFGDMASDAYDSFFSPPSPQRRRHPVNNPQTQSENSSTTNSAEYDTEAVDNGGVRIPTFEEYRSQQESKNKQFFDMKRQEEEAAAKKREQEEQRQLDEVYKELEQEIKKYEAQQQKMDENIEKLKKLIIAERTNKYKKGKYAFTVAEIGRMIMKTALISISESNNWLEAVTTKRKKRGSLFAARSKKQGTQYSMSQEISITRSVQ